MFTRKLVRSAIVIIGSTAFAALVGVWSSRASAAQACVFDKYVPTTVEPYRARESVGYGSYTSVKGAQLYIPAQEGLTKEWLELSIERAFASDQACHPDVKPMQVSVASAGNGFWVELIGHDAKQGQALLHWAETIVKQYAAHHTATNTQ